MLTKECLLFLFTIILLHCLKTECRQIRCYSCSDCSNSTSVPNNFIITSHDQDQCMKTTVMTGEYRNGQQLINRGASSNCEPYSNQYFSILCCRDDFCNV